MKKTGTFTYSKHIFLDKSRMGELFVLLKKHCDDFIIYAETIDKSSIEFESFDELMEYNNFKNGRIKNMSICGYSQNFIYKVIDLTISSEYTFLPTVKCIYKFSQQDEEKIFTIKLQEIFDKSKSFHVPVVISTPIFSFITSVLLTYVLLKVLSHNGYELPYTVNSIMIIAISLTVSRLFLLIDIKLFPPVCFSWGEAIRYYKQLNDWRSKLFWGVFAAIVIAVIANYISNQLFIS